MGYWGGYSDWAPRPTVATRKADAAREIAKLQKKGRTVEPVVLEGSTIARTFWGKAWCRNLESYSDFENRLPRGRSYVRSGSVLDLQIAAGRVEALVRGSDLYEVVITVKPVEPARYRAVVAACAGKVDSVIELLQGKLSGAVMEVITRKEEGLFPAPRQLGMSCTCPDYASMCKHVAAVLYGIGARFDVDPKLVFLLRGADPGELVSSAAAGTLTGGRGPAREKTLSGDLASMFGIEAGPRPGGRTSAPARRPQRRRPQRRRRSLRRRRPRRRRRRRRRRQGRARRHHRRPSPAWDAQSTSRSPTGNPSPKNAARSASATGTYSRTGRT